MKLVIAGCRGLFPEIQDIALIMEKASIKIDEIEEVVSGKAKGVDTKGEVFAEANGLKVKEFPAEWHKYKRPFGKSNPAGVIRNQKMAEYCDKAVLIWDGQSRGTKNMKENMDKLGKPYFLVIVTDNEYSTFKYKWFNNGI